VQKLTTKFLAAGLLLASFFVSGKALADETAAPTLEVRYPNGGSVTCPLRTTRTSVLFIFNSSSLDSDPGEACRALVTAMEKQQNVNDLRTLIFQMRGRTQDEYQRALANFLLGKLGVSSSTIAQIEVSLAADFFEWTDEQVIEYLNEQYDLNMRRLQRINEIRRRNPGALRGT